MNPANQKPLGTTALASYPDPLGVGWVRLEESVPAFFYTEKLRGPTR